MNRSIVAAVGVTALVASGAFVWLNARQEREYRRLIDAGEAASTQNRTFEAIEAFSGALTLKPKSTIARLKRGDTYRRRGEFGSAVRDLREATLLDPTAPKPLELLGDVYAAMGRLDEAAGNYDRCLRLDDRAPRVLYKLALVQYRAGKHRLAAQTLQRVINLDDTLAEAHYLLGLSLRRPQHQAEAERQLLRAVEIDPDLAVAREELVTMYAATGRQQKALDQLEALSLIEPARPERLVRIGLTQARMGRRGAALLTLERAAERHPDAASVRTAVGRVWLEIADPPGDRFALRKALDALAPIAARPNAASDALTLYGRALYLSGDYAAAEAALRRAVGQFPVDPPAFAYLAAVAQRLGHRDLARLAAVQSAALGER